MVVVVVVQGETADIHVASRRLVAPNHVRIACPAITAEHVAMRHPRRASIEAGNARSRVRGT